MPAWWDKRKPLAKDFTCAPWEGYFPTVSDSKAAIEELVPLIAWRFGADKPFARIDGPLALVTVDSCWPLHNHLTYPASLEGEAQALPVERNSGGYHKIPIAYLRH